MQQKYTLADVAEVRPGYQFRSKVPEVERGRPVLQASDIAASDLTVRFAGAKRTNESIDPRFLVQGKDVLIVSRAVPGSKFKAGVVPADLAGAVATTSVYTIRIADPNQLLPEFLALYLSSAAGQRAIQQHATGTVALAVPRRALSTIFVPVPSLREQQDCIAYRSALTTLQARYEQKVSLLDGLLQGKFYQLTNAGV